MCSYFWRVPKGFLTLTFYCIIVVFITTFNCINIEYLHRIQKSFCSLSSSFWTPLGLERRDGLKVRVVFVPWNRSCLHTHRMRNFHTGLCVWFTRSKPSHNNNNNVNKSLKLVYIVHCVRSVFIKSFQWFVSVLMLGVVRCCLESLFRLSLRTSIVLNYKFIGQKVFFNIPYVSLDFHSG